MYWEGYLIKIYIYHVDRLVTTNKINSQSRTVSGDYIVYLRDFALSKGIAARTLLKESNAALALLLNPPEQVEESIFHKIGSNLFTSLKVPYSGVLQFGKGMLLSLHGPLGVAIQGANNLKEVAILAEKYYQTRATSRSLLLVEAPDFFCLRLSEEGIQYDHYLSMATLVSFEYIIARLLSHHHLMGECIVHQQTAEPENFPWNEVRGYQLLFNQVHNQILVPQTWMEYATKPIDSELADLAKSQCDQTLEELLPLGLENEIRLRLKSFPDKNIGLKEMAHQLHVSPSTLQRRLREFDITFKKIKLEERLNEAKELLFDQNYNLERISEHLGFCDASSFTKSFKTFTGQTPTEYRRAHSE